MPGPDKHSEDRSRRRFLWAVGAALLLVLLPLGGASAATSSGANGDVAFVRSGDLYLVSTGLVLVPGAIDPSWSPDGKTLAFSKGGLIETCTVATCTPAQLSTATGTEPVWSPDGTKIAYVTGGTIHTIGTSAPFTDTPIATGVDPTWSPDSTKIAFATGSAIFTCAIASCGSPTSLVASGVQPAWSPDGSTIAYQSVSVPAQIFVIPAVGGTSAAVPTNAANADTAPTWSPDGTSIVYADNANGIQEVTKAGSGWTSPATGGDSNSADLTPDMQTVAPDANNPPSISGGAAPQTGQLLSTTNGTWSGATGAFTYVWERCDGSGASCAAIGGATASTYAPVSADLTHTLRTIVTASNVAGLTPSAASAATGVVTAGGTLSPPVNTVAPAISLPTGETAPLLGDVLFASAGTWSGSFPMTFAYSWAKCPAADPLDGPCVSIPGATLSFFTVPASLYGLRIRVRVTATNTVTSVPTT